MQLVDGGDVVVVTLRVKILQAPGVDRAGVEAGYVNLGDVLGRQGVDSGEEFARSLFGECEGDYAGWRYPGGEVRGDEVDKCPCLAGAGGGKDGGVL